MRNQSSSIENTPLSEILEKSVDFIIYFLFFTAPLFYISIWRDPYEMSRYFFIITLCLLINIYYFFLKKDLVTTGSILLIFNLAFLILLVLSTIKASNILLALLPKKELLTQHFIHLVTMALTSLSIFEWIKLDTQKKIQNLALLATMCLFLIVLINLIFYPFSTLSVNERASLVIGEPNRLAFVILILMPLSIIKVFSNKEHYFTKAFSLLTFFSSSMVLILSQSRGAWICFFITVIVGIYFLCKEYRFRLKLKEHFLLNILILLVFLLFILPFTGLITIRFSPLVRDWKNNQGSLSHRVREWQKALALFQDLRPTDKFIGLGPNNASLYLMKYKSEKENTFIAQNERNLRIFLVRNQPLQHLINIGVLGVSLLVVFHSLIIYSFYKLKQRNQEDILLFLSYLSTILIGFIYYHNILISFYHWFLLGLICVKLNTSLQLKVISSFFNKASNYYLRVIQVIVLIFIFHTSTYAYTEYKYNQGDFLKAYTVMPWNDEYSRKLSRSYSSLAYSDKSPLLVKEAIKYAERAYSLNPYEIENLEALQLAYYRSGVNINKKDHKKAILYGKQRLLLDPGRVEPYDALGLAYLDLGELDLAETYFQKAINIDSNYFGSYLHLGEVNKQKQQFKKALEYYQKALDLNFSSPEAIEGIQFINSILRQKDSN